MVEKEMMKNLYEAMCSDLTARRIFFESAEQLKPGEEKEIFLQIEEVFNRQASKSGWNISLTDFIERMASEELHLDSLEQVVGGGTAPSTDELRAFLAELIKRMIETGQSVIKNS